MPCLPYGYIKQIKEQIKQATKGTQTISNYTQFIKTRANELTSLGKNYGS